MKTLNLSTREELLHLKTLLNQVSQVSFSFSNVNKDFPLEEITESQAKQLISFYKTLLKDVSIPIKQFLEEEKNEMV